MHRLFSDTPLSDSKLGKTEPFRSSADGEEIGDKPGNVEPSKTTQTTKKYDESLFKALYRTFYKRIWGSAILLVISGKRKSESIFWNELVFCNISLPNRHAQNDHSSIKQGHPHLAHRVIFLF